MTNFTIFWPRLAFFWRNCLDFILCEVLLYLLHKFLLFAFLLCQRLFYLPPYNINYDRLARTNLVAPIKTGKCAFLCVYACVYDDMFSGTILAANHVTNKSRRHWPCPISGNKTHKQKKRWDSPACVSHTIDGWCHTCTQITHTRGWAVRKATKHINLATLHSDTKA